MEYKSIEKLARKLLIDWYKDYDGEYLGESFFAFLKAKETYDPTRGEFTTWFRHKFSGHLKDYFQYNSPNRLIHIPVKKQTENNYSYVGIDEPLNGTEFTLSDTLSSPVESTLDDIDIKVPTHLTEALNVIIEASDEGISERKYMIENMKLEYKELKSMTTKCWECRKYLKARKKL